MKQTLQKPTILYDTTFPTGTQIDYDSLLEMGIVCAITIPAAQQILDQSPMAQQLVVRQITFPPKTTFFYKKRNDQTDYAAQRVPHSLLLTQDLKVTGLAIPASTDWSFVTSVELPDEDLGNAEELEADVFGTTLLGILQESVDINDIVLRPKTHLTLNEQVLAWQYTEATKDQRTSTESRGILRSYRAFVEQALETQQWQPEHEEALRFLATDYFQETVEWASTLLGHHYRDQGQPQLAAQYYRRAYKIALRTKGANSKAAQQLDEWLSGLRLGASTAEKKYVLRRLYLTNSLLLVVLFYVGIHLREEEVAVLEGLRPNVTAYDWTSVSYALLVTGCALFALYAGWKAWATLRRIGGLMLLLSIWALLYSGYVLGIEQTISMTTALLFYGPYIVFSIWLNAYALMLGDREMLFEEEQ